MDYKTTSIPQSRLDAFNEKQRIERFLDSGTMNRQHTLNASVRLYWLCGYLAAKDQTSQEAASFMERMG